MLGVAGLPAWMLQLILPVGFGLIGLRYLVLSGLRGKGIFSTKPSA